jgi:hypothetical protein
MPESKSVKVEEEIRFVMKVGELRILAGNNSYHSGMKLLYIMPSAFQIL